ncbi:hypothetical protein [Siccibacter colletis]|uniref:hypothetical protein n=1 Tax=Siccibacter colletis TaxID=1505757 RepID=UPI0009DE5769|nr:hypothetical protein [Siccibacter colletis]
MIEQRNIKIIKGEITLFIVTYFIYTLKSIIISLEIDEDYITIVSSVSNSIIITMVCLGFLLFDNKKKILIAFTSILFVINLLIYNNPVYFGYLVLMHLLMLSNGMPWKNVISILFFVNVLVIVVCVPLLFLADSHYMIDDRTGQRLTLGFHNPNTLSQYALTLFSIIVLWGREHIKSVSIETLNLVIAFSVLLLVTYMSGSRTSILLSIILLCGYLMSFTLRKQYKKRSWFVLSYFSVALVIAFLQFYYSSIYITSDLAKLLNELLSSRIWYSYLLITEMSYPAIFHSINIDIYMPIDFFFLSYFYNLGWLPGLVFIFIYYNKMKEQTFTFAMCVALWGALAISLSENYYTIAIYNVGLFATFSQRFYTGIRK